jgi:hypothetical protein
MLKRICLWINYTIGTVGGYKPGHPLHVPAVVPAYGDYSNWMAIRGFHANRTAHPMPDNITVYGFWVNDPYPSSLGGLGENSFKALSTWVDTYYLPVVSNDSYNGKFVAIFEPPEITNDVDFTIAESPPRFTPAQQNVIQQTREQEGEIPSDLLKQIDQWIVQAAVEGVAQQLIPYDEDFAAAFAKTIPGKPLFVESLGGGDYYAVPFNIKYKDKSLGGIRKSVDTRMATTIVVIVDSVDGSFMEASWVKSPVRYLPLSKSDVLKMLPDILEELGFEPGDINEIGIHLVHRKSTPYYPDWRVTIKEYGLNIYIRQDGTITYIM